MLGRAASQRPDGASGEEPGVEGVRAVNRHRHGPVNHDVLAVVGGVRFGDHGVRGEHHGGRGVNRETHETREKQADCFNHKRAIGKDHRTTGRRAAGPRRAEIGNGGGDGRWEMEDAAERKNAKCRMQKCFAYFGYFVVNSSLHCYTQTCSQAAKVLHPKPESRQNHGGTES